MLLWGFNVVGYIVYLDNFIIKFIEEVVEVGIDIFCIFDFFNWVEVMKVSIKIVRECIDSIVEACFCYIGDIIDFIWIKYILQYYFDLAKQLEDYGVYIIVIKDMVGLLKLLVVEELISVLKDIVYILIYLYMYDIVFIQASIYMIVVEVGVDVIDVVISLMFGLIFQFNFNVVVVVMKGYEWEYLINLYFLNEFFVYWEVVCWYYYLFEIELCFGIVEVYEYEIFGGQYFNLWLQVWVFGLEEKFEIIKKNYCVVNDLFGDIVKVIFFFKVVGDMVMFMIFNNLICEDIF